MGIFNSSSDKDIESTALEAEKPLNSSSLLNDSLESLITVTNDVTSASLFNLMDWSEKFLKNELGIGRNGGLFDPENDRIGSGILGLLPSSFDSDIFQNLKQRLSSHVTPYGFWSYPVPSPELHSECKKLEGLSVWDTNGYWRCLFPNAKIPEQFKDRTVSKEDVENDKAHEKGLFFANFADYLEFKSRMNDLARQKREQEWRRFKEDQAAKWGFLRRKLDDSTASTAGSAPQTDDLFDSRVAETSTSTSIRTLENGDVEKITVKKQIFQDGTGELKEVKEVLDSKGKRKTIDRNFQELGIPASAASASESGSETLDLVAANQSRDKRSGWFWDNSEKKE